MTSWPPKNASRGALLLSCLVLLATPPAAAQEAGRVGLTIGHPTAVGLIWHATDRLALRPELSFSFSTTESDVATGPFPWSSSGEGTAVGAGVGVLYYLQAPAAFRTYLSPRYAFARTTSSSTAVTGSASETTQRGHAWSASFGAQYLPTSRFGVYGEAGLGGAHARTRSSVSGMRTTSRTWGTRGGVGVVVYFAGG